MLRILHLLVGRMPSGISRLLSYPPRHVCPRYAQIGQCLNREAAEGEDTTAVELLAGTPFDAVVVPLVHGGMLTGVARWAHAVNPTIGLICVQARALMPWTRATVRQYLTLSNAGSLIGISRRRRLEPR